MKEHLWWLIVTEKKKKIAEILYWNGFCRVSNVVLHLFHTQIFFLITKIENFMEQFF